MRRIGEILLERGWVDPDVLGRALARQPESGMRTCSYLIACDVIDPDTASRALGEQHGVAAALQRHLERRDRELGARLPAGTAQLYMALPLGRMNNGDVIVCVRDPRPGLGGLLSRALDEKVVLAVAPATQLEALVVETYGDDANEFEVDLGTQPIPISLELELAPDPPIDDDDYDNIPELDNLQLVELDDTRVSKDPSQIGLVIPPIAQVQPTRSSATLPPSTARPQVSGLHAVPRSQPAIAIPATAPPPRSITPPGGLEALALGTQPPKKDAAPAQLGQLAETLSILASARTHDDIADAAMRYIASRWRAALLFAVEGHVVGGLRGHGAKLSAEVVRSISIALDGPSIIAAACRAPGRLITGLPPGGDEVHDQLERLLGVPRFPAATGIAVGTACEYVLVVGDPNGSDVQAATGDLNRIATALSAAYTRLERR